MALGSLLGGVIFTLRMMDPKGMNLPLMRFNRWLVAAVALAAFVAFVWGLLSVLSRKHLPSGWTVRGHLLSLFVLILLALTYLVPQILQFTQEFVYFGEMGVSTNALLRGVGFTFGLVVCLLLALSACRVSLALEGRGDALFLALSTLFFFLEYGVRAVAALQRLKVIPLSDLVFSIMIFGDQYKNAFLFAQLLLGAVMLARVILTHRTPVGTFKNRALLRREKARLRSCRRWSWGLAVWSLLAVFIVVVVHYYDTKPPAELQPESYTLNDGVIIIELDQVSDGHLHKFSYVTPNGFDVHFLAVKKPAGNAYGVGLDACEICGIAGYFERGNDVVCRRCDVVMNKNTIGFRGGCNPIPFPYEIKDSKIYIDVRELQRHEKRFR